MTRYISKPTLAIRAFFYKIDPFKNLEKTIIEITDNGFKIIYPWSLFGPKKKCMSWKNIKEIHAELLDCFAVHVLRLDFIDFQEKIIIADNVMEGWDSLYKELLKQFPNFNTRNFETVNSFFPKEGSLLCWKFDEEVKDFEPENSSKGKNSNKLG